MSRANDVIQELLERSGVGRIKVLVVEDQKIQAKKLMRLLQQWGYDAEWAENGQLVLDRLASAEPIDLAISDVQMPVLDGLGFLKALRSAPATRSLPVVMVTTLDDEEVMKTAVTSGVEDFVVKPYEPLELQLRIRNIVEKIQARAIVSQQIAAMENSAEGMAILDAEGRVAYCNTTQLKDFGFYTLEAILGKRWEHLYPAESLGQINDIILPEVRKNGLWRGTIKAHRGPGREYIQDLSITRLAELGYSFVCRDVTDQIHAQDELHRMNLELKKAEESARASARLKGEFLANMSHEIRTPLNGILGVSQLLAHTALTAEQKKYVDFFMESGRNLLRLLNDILDFSKIEANAIEFCHEEFDLSRAVENALKGHRVVAEGKGVQFDLTLPEGEDRRLPVVGDEMRILQVLGNVVSNAVKFTDSGSVKVSLHLVTTESPNQAQEPGAEQVVAHFEVEDSGPGIPEEFVGKLYEEFTQVDPSTTRRFGGTGLGMAIAMKLLRRMNGGISLKPAQKCGSVFRFHIPLVRRRAENIQSGVSGAPSRAHSALMTSRPEGRVDW